MGPTLQIPKKSYFHCLDADADSPTTPIVPTLEWYHLMPPVHLFHVGPPLPYASGILTICCQSLATMAQQLAPAVLCCWRFRNSN